MSIITKDLGAVTAYAYAVEQGYTGTEEEFAELMADYATVAEEAAESAESASASATSASASAQTATTKAGEASTSATQAGASATSASQSASTATAKASEASASASTASTKASEASASATSAQTAQTAAKGSATTAQTAAQTATQKAAEAAESARTLTIDTTLTQSGQAADAKVTGDEIEDLKEDLKEFENATFDISSKKDIVTGKIALLSDTVEYPCLVNGQSGTNVKIIGKNILNINDTTRETIANDGTVSPSTTALLSDYIPIVGRSVCASWGEMIGNCAVRIAWFDENKNFILRQASSNAEIVQNGTVQRTLPDSYNPKFIRICWDDYTGTNERHLRNLMVELSTTRSDYEEYKSQNLSLPSKNGRTYDLRTLVYSLDQTDVTIEYINTAIQSESYTDVSGDGDTFRMTIGQNQSGAMANDRNIAIGYGNMSNATSNKCMTVGIENMSNTSGEQNSSFGYHSQFRTTTGRMNASFGNESCDDNTTGSYNTGLGAYSLQRNSKGDGNTAVGYKALQGASSAFNENNKWDYDTAVGYNALLKRTSGYSSTAVGANAASSQTTGNYNTAVGAGALKTNVTGHYNTAVGYNADVSGANLTNATAIGNGAKATQSNQIVFGNSAVESVIIGNKRIVFNADNTVTWETLT